MLTWNGEPLRRRREHPLQKHLEILAEAAAMPPKMWWATLDSILALPVTTDCCPLEWLEDEG